MGTTGFVAPTCEPTRTADTRWLAYGRWPLLRLRPDGPPDSSFSDDGRWVAPSTHTTGVGVAVDVRRDGQVVVAAEGSHAYGTTEGDMMIWQLTAAGTPDPAFSGDGFATIDFDGGAADYPSGMRLSGGKVVVAGSSSKNGKGSLAVARLTRRGRLDRTFSENGKRLWGLRGHDAVAHAVTVDGYGRVVVTGSLRARRTISETRYEHRVSWVIARFRSNGTLDDSFSGNGVARPMWETIQDWGQSVVEQPDGQLVFGGTIYGRHGILRLKP